MSGKKILWVTDNAGFVKIQQKSHCMHERGQDSDVPNKRSSTDHRIWVVQAHGWTFSTGSGAFWGLVVAQVIVSKRKPASSRVMARMQSVVLVIYAWFSPHLELTEEALAYLPYARVVDNSDAHLSY